MNSGPQQFSSDLPQEFTTRAYPVTVQKCTVSDYGVSTLVAVLQRDPTETVLEHLYRTVGAIKASTCQLSTPTIRFFKQKAT